jgi:hypothetical protein
MLIESDRGIWARYVRSDTRFGLPVAVLVVLMLAPARHSLALQPADNPWLGKRVITQYGTVLQVGNQVFTEYTISLAELDRLEEGNKPRTNQKAGSNPQRR